MDKQVVSEFIDKIRVVAAVIGKYNNGHSYAPYDAGDKRTVDLVEPRLAVQVEVSTRKQVRKQPTSRYQHQRIEVVPVVKAVQGLEVREVRTDMFAVHP